MRLATSGTRARSSAPLWSATKGSERLYLQRKSKGRILSFGVSLDGGKIEQKAQVLTKEFGVVGEEDDEAFEKN